MAITAASTSIPSDIDTRTDIASSFKKIRKGVTPTPSLVITDQDNGLVKIQFSPGDFPSNCEGEVDCLAGVLSMSWGASNAIVCNSDGTFEVYVPDQTFSDGEPVVVTFTFEDSAGNTGEASAYSIVGVRPMAPTLTHEETDDASRNHQKVDITLESWSNYSLTGVVSQYQIERYIDNPNNRRTWVDWRDSDRTLTHRDIDVQLGVEYGYRVRFKIGEGNISDWSSWAADTVPA